MFLLEAQYFCGYIYLKWCTLVTQVYRHTAQEHREKWAD